MLESWFLIIWVLTIYIWKLYPTLNIIFDYVEQLFNLKSSKINNTNKNDCMFGNLQQSSHYNIQ